MSLITIEPERRFTVGECRLDDTEAKRIRGHAIVFNSRSVNLGGFYEIITPAAVDRTLRLADDVRALVNHDTSKVLGRTKAGTLMLKKDRNGLAVSIDPPRTSYSQDIQESIGRGDVSGMSFRFRVMPDGDTWDEEDGQLIRTVHDMTFDEISVVSFPAYEQTDVLVSARALERVQALTMGRSVAWLRREHRTRLAR
jgi:HK97 family phage prohead protease